MRIGDDPASFRNPMICCSVKRFFMFVFFSENELY